MISWHVESNAVCIYSLLEPHHQIVGVANHDHLLEWVDVKTGARSGNLIEV
jgi:hypothetical protein